MPFLGAGISAAVIQLRGRKLRRQKDVAAEQDKSTGSDTELKIPTPEA